MRYSVTSLLQLSNFLSALGFGFVIGLIYFIIEFVFKTICRSKKYILIEDVVFSVITAILTFVFMQIYTDGEVRFDLILSAAIGFFILYFSVGKYIRKVLSGLSSRLNKVISVLILPFGFISKKLSNQAVKIKKKVNVKREKEKTVKKAEPCVNKHKINLKILKKSKNSLENLP